MTRVGLVTCEQLPEVTADDALVLTHLRALYVDAVPVIWNAKNQNWNGFDALIIRSCWDYHKKAIAFNEWLDGIEVLRVPLWNCAKTVRWNMDKRYLKGFAANGIAVPRTTWVESGSKVDLETLLTVMRVDQAVVKPTISISAQQTWCTSPSHARVHQSQLDRILETSGAMVQEFVPELVSEGEWSLVFFRGDYSHAVLKRPKDGDFRVQSQFGGEIIFRRPPANLIAQAEAIVRRIPEPLLYARVDGVELNGVFMLMELELIEPELFLRAHPLAPRRFADAIASVL